MTLAYDDARVWKNRSVLSQMPFLPALARVETKLAPPSATDWLTSQPSSRRSAELYPDALKRLDNTLSSDTLVVTDTGQIKRDTATGILTVDTPRTQLATGFLAAVDRVKLRDLHIECATRFAT
ncbi:MAG TPA: hypothetical protein EYP14_12030, partial [Planctomycetaceae bacterium]|nr:hypothetical protein [Planctomycetaceae bacterium]